MWEAAPTRTLQHAANTQYSPLPLPHTHTHTHGRQTARSRTAMIAAARARASRDLGRDLLAEDAEASGPVERAARCLFHVTSAGAIRHRCDICGSDPPNTMAHCIHHKPCSSCARNSTSSCDASQCAAALPHRHRSFQPQHSEVKALMMWRRGVCAVGLRQR
jgi:hypothetical protein